MVDIFLLMNHKVNFSEIIILNKTSKTEFKLSNNDSNSDIIQIVVEMWKN